MNKADKKMVALIVILAVVLIAAIFSVAKSTKPENTTAAQIQTTPVITQSVPAVSETQTTVISETSTVTDTTAQSSETEAPASGVPQTKAEIVAAYNKVINDAKHIQNATVSKGTSPSIEITQLPAESIKGVLNSVIGTIAKPTDETFTFTNGIDTDGNTPASVISPADRDVTLSEDGVANATATADGDGYKMTIVLVPETASFDGTNTVKPVHHDSCLAPIDLSEVNAGPAEITNATMELPGATLNISVDSQGRLTHYDYSMPMSAVCTCSVKIASVDLGMNCGASENYDITY